MPAPVRDHCFDLVCSRRDVLAHFATGLRGMALATLLARDAAAGPAQGAASGLPHHPPKARRAIQIFLQGGLSQVDSFDYKPALEKLHGQSVPGDERPMGFMGRVGRLHKAHFAFRQRGRSGLWVSDLFPHLAELADELTVIRSMWSGTGNHTPATYEANSGFRTLGFPAAGSWISYGLGCEVDNLPTFVVLPDRRECADFARACLLARRLVERGVRFVQLWSGAAFGGDVHWDAHGSVPNNHRRESDKIDRPVAGLLRDLRQRGLLDDTLVICNTEFGRTPYAESAGNQAGPGRDHNPDAFTIWLAGAGLQHGIAYGASDDIGWKTAENLVDVHDFHATILHLLGIDHERLTFYHNGIQRRLTNVHGNVLTDLLA